MQNFKSLFIFLFGLSLGALIWGVGFIFLKKEPIFYVPIKKDYSFFSINLTNIFFNTFQIRKIKPIQTLKGVKLKAIYYNGKNGFVILEEKGKTVFVDLGQKYKGYKLVDIYMNYVIFEKNGKRYKLDLEKEKIKNTFLIKTKEAYDSISVPKKIFYNYLNNFNKIWQNIGILKTKKGYLITYINPTSIFDKMGLKKGDILLEVNGRKLKNDADAWNIYRHASEFNRFEIKILRNNKEKVITYEVD
jgi:type II secretion system protein C